MAHGYARDYDEGWDRGDDRDRQRQGRSDWQERGERDWRDRDSVWRGDRESHQDRGRGFMLSDEDRDYGRHRGQDRGSFSRAGGEARSWFSDHERQDRGAWENNRDWPQSDRGYGRQESYGSRPGNNRQQSGFGGSNEWRGGQGSRESGSYSANPDDHYRSWRDRQMQSLDRDYQDYCREREQQFHQDFDSWRQSRQQNQQTQGSATQQSQPGGGSDQSIMELNDPSRLTGETQGAAASGTSAATLGTNNSENSDTPTGRGRR